MIVRRCLWLVVSALLMAAAAEAQPVIRVAVRPTGRHLVGQQVQIDVQVLVPNFFMSPVKFPVLDVQGAVVTMPDESGVNLNDTIKGQSYAGVQKTYVFVAQAAGKYTLPPARVTFRYALEPGKPTDGSVALPPTVIEVDWPAGAAPSAGGQGPLVTTVSMTQTLDRNPAMLHVGDALTRTVAITAARTQAMFIPPPDFTAPTDVRLYRKDPVLADDQQDRVGLVAGHRTDRVVYTFDKPRTYVLPAVEIAWFDAASNTRKTARGEAVTAVVAAADPAAAGAIAPEAPPMPAAEQSGHRLRRLAIVAAAFLLLLTMAWASRRLALRAVRRAIVLCRRGWTALRRDRARHLPPLNPA